MIDRSSLGSHALCQQISALLADFSHPTLERDLHTLAAVQQCEWQQKILKITLRMPFVWQQGFFALQHSEMEALCRATGAQKIIWQLKYDVATLKRANQCAAVSGVRNIIAMSSSKGGVGKSSLAVNLALALAKEGGRVGLLDADIYGPSVPAMLGTDRQKLAMPEDGRLRPRSVHGIFTQSIGYLLAEQDAAIWRGPMASRALVQLLQETAWPDLDYLLIDMPPGTGDLQLTLAQQIPVTAVIIITTPQIIALSDTVRGITLFEKVHVPILGIIENMSSHVCSHCGHHEWLFGTGGGQKIAQHYHLPLLGQLPLHLRLREDLDQGMPTVVRHPTGELACWFKQLAATVAASLYWRGEPIATEITVRCLS